MPSSLFVSYLRIDVSEPDFGLSAQRDSVDRFVNACGRRAAEVIETGPDACGSDWPGLREAVALCRRCGATLLMARLDAFGDDPAFLHALSGALRAADLPFAAADNPEASERTLGIMAALAEAGDRLGVSRSPEATARRREFFARLTAEGRAEPSLKPAIDLDRSYPWIGEGDASPPRSRQRAEAVAPILGEVRAAGASTLEQVANALNALGVPSARGMRWYPMQVTRIDKRLGGAAARPAARPHRHPLHA